MWDWISKSNELRHNNETFAIVSVIRVGGSTPRNTDSKMVVKSDGTIFGTVGGGLVEDKVRSETMICIKENKNRILEFDLTAKAGQMCGGMMEVFIEIVSERPNLIIFGAGHVGQAVSDIMSKTIFRVHLIDEREEWIDHKNLSDNIVKYPKLWREVVDSLPYDSNLTYAVVMTYGHSHDFEIMENLVFRKLKFLGMIASKNKSNELMKILKSSGATVYDLEKVVSPIGEKKIGKTPVEVAISLSYQLLSIYYDK